MQNYLILYPLFGIFAISHGSDSEEFETFIEDIIETWELLLPTIIIKDDIPGMCMTRNRQRVLCLPNNQDTNELVDHLALIDQHREQDGLIFVGCQRHENILKLLSQVAPSILTTSYPVFIPICYKPNFQLRLDSNVLFYRETETSNYELTYLLSKVDLPLN